MKDFIKVSPLKVLEKSSQRGLGRGNLGVLMARAGVGKTACLIHIAFDKLFRKEKLVHVSLEDVPEKITSYYNVIFYDLVKALNMDDEHEVRMLFERNRMILAYLQQSFEIKRLRENLKNLVEKIDFVPDALIVDGLDFEKADRNVFESFKEIAEQFRVEMWFSARTHRHITDVNERGIPYPCHELDDLFNIIIQLQPTQSGIVLKLLKDHGVVVSPEASVKLDPNTFLVMSE
jgi:KaiC/GvpD/RAD55 family RecA-like ATPase